MTLVSPELPRPVAVDRASAGLRLQVEASPTECEAVAKRMVLLAVKFLTCRFDLKRGESGAVLADGVLRARVTQNCVVSLEPFDADITELFSVRFVPEHALTEDPDIEDDDEIPYEGSTIDLGEATCEQLALALDPFPRKPGAELPAVAEDSQDNPFAALAKLRPS